VAVRSAGESSDFDFSVARLSLILGAGILARICYLFIESQTAFAIFAMVPSRIASSAGESDTKTAIARCFPLGNVIMPISFVAAVIPFSVPDVPVLCATFVPAGRSPFKRLGPGVDSVMNLKTSA
jgi:hypothetical protein